MTKIILKRKALELRKHGTCNIRVCNTMVRDRILMSIKAIADYSQQYISEL